MSKSSESVCASKSKDSNLQKVWNGSYGEIQFLKRRMLGRVLTIIDSVIVNEKQNKSIKDIITHTIWEDDNCEKMIARWLNWLDNISDIRNGECDESEPMLYDGIPASELKSYK